MLLLDRVVGSILSPIFLHTSVKNISNYYQLNGSAHFDQSQVNNHHVHVNASNTMVHSVSGNENKIFNHRDSYINLTSIFDGTVFIFHTFDNRASYYIYITVIFMTFLLLIMILYYRNSQNASKERRCHFFSRKKEKFVIHY